jgi:Restriction endonuclease
MAARTESTQSKPIVDMVCDVCRAEGFQVVKNSSPTRNTPAVDIVASRNDEGIERKLAFDCWEGESRVSGHQVEDFVRRIHSLKLEGGVYVSSRGFTEEAEFMAKKLRVELWDLAKLKEHLIRISPSETARIPWTLPVSRQTASRVFMTGLENGARLRMANLPHLEFRPYIFVRFTVPSGKSSGVAILVLDGVDGRACDSRLLEGKVPLSPTGILTDCLDLEPLTGSMPQLPEGLDMKENMTVAELGISPDELEPKISSEIQAETGLPPGSFTINEARLLHVPILTVELGEGGKVYRRIVQAATARMIWDDSATCSYCKLLSNSLCETCWSTMCMEHERRCSHCSRPVCSSCAVSKGIMGKKNLCPACKAL